MSGLSVNVFDNIARSDASPAIETDAAFDYLNKSGRPEAEAVRALTNDWLSRYPAAHRDTLVSRLRSPIDSAHNSAFFELFLHELLLCRKHTILEIEPALEHTTSRPDFLVRGANGTEFFFEAVTVTEWSVTEQAARRRLDEAIAAINTLGTTDCYLYVDSIGLPSHPISRKRLRRQLSAWLANQPRNQGAHAVQAFVYEEHGLKLEVTAHFVDSKSGSRAIGLRMMEPRWSTPGEGIRESLIAKAKKYGSLPAPLVVAVNSLREFDDEDDAMDALFGTPCLVISGIGSGIRETRESRAPDGVWHDDQRPRRTGLSAVFSTERLRPWTVAQRSGRLICNPWARRPLLEIDLGVAHLSWNPEFQRRIGSGFAELLGLPDGWPGT